ncbi:MAG: BCCT family transporter [Proteobacteria bacterium]|nr:BCCT family transporter [Pseudomonadota bacterium]
MKIMQSYQSWIPAGTVILFAMSAVILSFPGAIHVFKFHWLSLAAVLIICFSPLGNKKFGTDQGVQKRYQWWSWLWQVFFLQGCLGAIFFGILVTCAIKVPVLTPAQPQLLQNSWYQLLISQGLFPWAVVGLLAITFSFWSYQKNQDAYFASLIKTLNQKALIEIIINFFGRCSTVFVYCSTLCLLGLLWASFIGNLPIAVGFALAPLITSLILLLFTLSKLYRRTINKLFSQGLPLFIALFFWVIFFAVAIWLVNGFVILVAHSQFPAPKLLSYWLKQPWTKLGLIFINSWWLLWTPITAITIARISRGYSVRSILLAILILPLLAAVTLRLTAGHSWQLPPLAAGIASGIGLLGIFWMTLRKTGIPAFILTYLPRRDHYKFRSYRRTLVQLTKIAVIIFFIYMPSGIVVIHFFAFCLALPLIVMSIMATILAPLLPN